MIENLLVNILWITLALAAMSAIGCVVINKIFPEPPPSIRALDQGLLAVLAASVSTLLSPWVLLKQLMRSGEHPSIETTDDKKPLK